MKSTKKSLWMSVLSLILCLTMLLGTTWAWFTDSVTSGVNRIVAGNLDIEVEYTLDNGGTWENLQNSASVFSKSLWEPGHTEYVTLKITNKGTLALKYQMNVTPVTEKGGINVAGEQFQLSDYLKFGTTAASATLPTYTRETARAAAVNDGPLTQAGVASLRQPSTMQPKAVQYMTLVVYMPETVGNEANYKTGTTAPEIDLGIKVLATQLTSEKDSFDSQYDASADFPALDKVIAYNYFPQVVQTAQLKKGDDGKAEIDVPDSTVAKDNGKITITSLATVSGDAPYASVVFSDTAVNFGDKTKANVTLVTEKKDSGSFTVEGKEKETVTYDVSVTTDAAFNDNAILTVRFFVGAGKQGITMKHGNDAMINVNTLDGTNPDTFTYDSDGFITMQVRHFSAFETNYNAPVAAIDTTAYYSVAEAAKNVQDDKTIVMLRDSTEEQPVALASGKNVGLDLNGKTLTVSQGIENNGTLQIKDSGSEGKVEAQITNKGNLKIEDGEFTETITNAEGAKTEATGGEFDKGLPKGSLPEGKKLDEEGKIVECVDHTPGAYTMTATGHSFVCTECNKTLTEEHQFTGGVCVCGYKSDAKLLEENPQFTCRVGNKGYVYPFGENTTAGKQCALKDAQSGDTIKLIADYKTTTAFYAYQKTNDCEITIDLNGHTIDIPKLQLTVGVYNIIDTSEAKTGSISKVDMYNNQDRLNTITVNVYGGSIPYIATDGDNGDKTLNIYGGNVTLLEVQGSEKAGTENRQAIDKVNITGGKVQYVSFNSSVDGNSVLTLGEGYTLGSEITDKNTKIGMYGSEFMANAYKVFPVTIA